MKHLSFYCAVALLLSACIGGTKRIAGSPMEVVRQSIPRDAYAVKIFGTGAAPNGDTAVIYEYRQPQSANRSQEHYILGLSLVSWTADSGWQANHTSLSGRDLVIELETPITYEVYQDGFTAVYGPVDKSQTTSVEAVFSTGQKTQQQIIDDYFLIFSPQPVDVCELVFYGKGEEVLERKSPSRQRDYSDACP